ncbi:zeta toxin family protein [Stenotrophomonas rhizophila]|uniref:zeta toxin family protein n=1 Tax=Stenotrophomonas rhizophila TaxID=216778 RepID=UPI001E40AD5D|nr:zeta toxin family protein [Stenotrophomonas rhizophila]MCC7634289.1 zeta toxin family protein [Stenotrophomonas rhizophila]MCC7663983.1 zeta toxin family protein [Stenotrophomonas rhizophila]
MSSPQAQLSNLDHFAVFNDVVWPESNLGYAKTHEQPRAVILAGQPGAGKGRLAQAAEYELSDDVVKVDPDELRDSHPEVENFRRKHPYTWSDHTHKDASLWAKELREAAIDGRKNIIIDTTLGNGNGAVDLINGLRGKGYEVEVRAVVAHRMESELGVDRRFADKLGDEGYGRYVPEDVRNHVYSALPGNLDKVHAETGIPIRLYSREGAELYDSRTDPRPPGPVLEAEREARLHNPRITHLTRDGWRDQARWHQDLPDTLQQHPRVAPPTAAALLTERGNLRVVEGVARGTAEATRIDHTVRVHPNMVRGATVGGIAATVYEAGTEGRKVADLYARDNATGAESALLNFGARSVGGWTGAIVGAKAGTLIGIESGPGAIVTGIVGAGLGAWGAGEVVDWIEKYRINNQRDTFGNVWTYDPTQPDAGWTRSAREVIGTVGTQVDRPIYGATQHFTADAGLTQELNYKASSRAVALRLAEPDVPVDPYRIAGDITDTPSLYPRAWERDAERGTWQREVVLQSYDRGIQRTTVEVAGADKAAELDAYAQATVALNAARSSAAYVQQYEQAYAQQGWSQHGPIPDAVAWTRSHPDHVMASDGRTYQRTAEGQWKHDGLIYDSHADGNVRDELNATYEQIRARYLQPEAPAPDAPGRGASGQPPQMHEGQASAAPGPAVAPPPALTPMQAGHPDHALYQQVRDGVAALDARHGREFDASSERMTASLLVLARSNGLERVDHVLLSNATPQHPAAHNVFVVQGEPNNPAHQRALMPTEQAVQTPVEASLHQLDVVGREQQRLQALQVEQQVHDQREQQGIQARGAKMG